MTNMNKKDLLMKALEEFREEVIVDRDIAANPPVYMHENDYHAYSGKELALDDVGITSRKLVQATPGALVKAHVHLPQKAMVTFPLIQPTERELDFYAFGGMIGFEGLEDVINNRVPGVDKRLMLIEPTAEGHAETPLSDLSPGLAAKKIGVGQEIVDERIRVLQRRAKVGTTGVYLDRPLAQDEGFEAVLEQITALDSLVRRRVKNRRRR